MSDGKDSAGADDIARWEALEAEARDRLEAEAREAAAESGGGPYVADAWDDDGPSSWWQEPGATEPPGDEVGAVPGGASVPGRAAAPEGPAPEILLADADPAIAASLEQAMADRGWTVRRVDTGDLALAEFLRHQPDVFVMDYTLPGLAGLDLLRRLTEMEMLDRARVIVNSTQTQTIHVQRAKAMGTHRFLDRPRHGPEPIVDAVAEQLDLLGLDVEGHGAASTTGAEAGDPAPAPAPEPAAEVESPPPTEPAGGLFADAPVDAAPTSEPEPAAEEPDRSYRSAFGSGGGPPGRIPKLG